MLGDIRHARTHHLLRPAYDEGMTSGEPREIDSEEFLARLKREAGLGG